MKSEPFQRDSRSGEKQTCPRRAPGGVWPPKSDTSPSSAFLLIRTSGASPAPTHSPSSFFPFLLLSSFALFLSFFFHTLSFFLSILPSFHSVSHPSAFPQELPRTLVLTPLPHFHLRAVGRQQGMRGLVRRFFELEQLLWVMAIHLPLSAPYTSIVGFRRWFIYTLTENYTWRTVWVASHVASLFSLRHRVAQVNTFNSEVALFKPLEVKSLNSILAAIITSRSRKSYFSHIHNFNSPVWSPKFFIARLKCPPSLNHTFPSPRELSAVLLWHLARAWGPVHERFEAFHTLFLWFCKAAVFA